ncbi:hypothetical protein SAMN04487995_1600 [Dyadobacter koreensis]|uniref:Uncharacterized protein n=1 Tax=Dyadobacter koreensis TaxID=408657 RepID=A0A1H6S373_9BACT|nr:hypothetical protein SAMN04487995_1600 [Dyadobacter koreensis]
MIEDWNELIIPENDVLILYPKIWLFGNLELSHTARKTKICADSLKGSTQIFIKGIYYKSEKTIDDVINRYAFGFCFKVSDNSVA